MSSPTETEVIASPSQETPGAPEGELSILCRDRTDKAQALVRKAAGLAERAHRSQRRASGEPYVTHPLKVAVIVNDLNMDTETVVAAILHDVVEDSTYTLDEIEAQFGTAVAHLVNGVTKMGRLSSSTEVMVRGGPRQESQGESLRKLLLATVEDVRVVLIKLADRLHNMRTLRYLSEKQQKRIAQETMDIYAPLASRLGIWQIKWELEDLAFRYLHPDTYREIAKLLHDRRENRESYIKRVVQQLRDELKRMGVNAEVTGRPKHIYSIWRKMNRKNVDFNKIFDVSAVRVLVPEVGDCYAVLGVVHSLWHHITGEFDDYIANPKENFYRSLHTAVIGPEGNTLEVQIRTHEMHKHAELGIAAHWHYKEGTRYEASLGSKIAWLRQLLDSREEESEEGDFVDRFKSESFDDRVYVLTPQGQVVNLPEGSTPVDFAYHIHTDVGHRCRGAKVNGRIVPLSHVLQSGDQVEILTTRQGGPSRDWLNTNLGYINSPRTRAKVRHWFKQQNLEKNISAGRSAVDRELRRLGIQDVKLDELADRLHAKDLNDFLGAVGRGDVSSAQIAGAAQEQGRSARIPDEIPTVQRRKPKRAKDSLKIHGVGNLLTNPARCCSPVPYDPIIGYITRGRGVSIHRRDCPNILGLKSDRRERLIAVEWGQDNEEAYPVNVQIQAYDRSGLLRDISAVLANDRVNVLGVSTHTEMDDNIATMNLTLEINDIRQLSRVLDRIGQLPNVLEARRRT